MARAKTPYEVVTLNIRFPKQAHSKLKKIAEKNRTSINYEVISTILKELNITL